MGDFEAGWARHDARFKLSSSAAYPKFSQPMWLGEENIEGKTILIHVDEGLGDTIQFARYVSQVAARGANVILVVADAVQPLLSGLRGVSKCLPLSIGTLPAFDMHCPLSSLPKVFGTTLDTIPAEIPYLPAAPQHLVQAWRDRLGGHDKLRVGLVWSGNPDHGNDHNRSIPLRALSPLSRSRRRLREPAERPAARRPGRAAGTQRHHRPHLATDRFRRDRSLDRVPRSRDHGRYQRRPSFRALGRPTWILLPYTPDYRWLLDRDDSPWYPTARLFRQSKTRDYASVLDRVRNELEALVAARRAK